MPNIAVIWDFDGTLTPMNSTTKVVEILEGKEWGEEFWHNITMLRHDEHSLSDKQRWRYILASDAPIWMYALSKMAFDRKIPLNKEYFQKHILSHIKTYDGVNCLLTKLKALNDTKEFRDINLNLYHFIISAGLKDLIELVFPDNLIYWVFGCKYKVIEKEQNGEIIPENIPVFCMDETMKTRSLFEISKGSFLDPAKSLNTRVARKDLWAPFCDIIYIGDGDTDVPALSLVRDRGGIGIVVYDKDAAQHEVDNKLRQMRLNKRADLITTADFTENSELFCYLENRCKQIRQRYEAQMIV